jgi:hypothetical protein
VKNAKSTLAAWLLLLHLCGPSRDRTANYSAPRRAGATCVLRQAGAERSASDYEAGDDRRTGEPELEQDPEDIVLDPFGGLGSTMIACEKAGRQARLIELDPKYCDVVVQRWQDWAGGTVTF